MPERYNEVADVLRQSILAGTIRPGSQLPTERELCLTHKVSRITIRHALRLLEEEQLIQRRQGSGTFVGPKPSRRIPLMIDYTGSVSAHAPRLRRTVNRWLWRPATGEVAGKLGLAPGESVLYAERTDEIDDTAVAWDQVYIPRSFGDPLTAEDLAKVDFVETWTRCAQFDIVTCRQIVEAVPATRDDQRRLRVKQGQPLLKSTEVYSTLRQRPAGLFVSYYHPRYVCISSQYQWQHGAQTSAASRRARSRTTHS